MPGGGQVGLAAPPPPPPADPEPVVVTVATATEVKAAPAVARDPATLSPSHRVVQFERRVDEARARSSTDVIAVAVSTRWLAARAAVTQLVASLLERWSVPRLLGWEQPAGDELGGGDVLDGQADRLEDGDGVGIATIRPRAPDGADLDELLFRH
jgi:hypothetical protein